MIDKVAETIRRFDMIPQGSRVIAAVSGGSDSVSMLTVLNELKEEFGFSLEAAHVNHCLRGAEADADEEFVRRLCEGMNIPFHLLRADVNKIAKEKGTGTEEAGRNIRYDFFRSLGEDAIIATAHNLSDREETFLFNFARGSALRGLCSIPPKRDNIIRPLIECSKTEIVDFCEKNNIKYVTDKTNSDIKYSRNRIRHNVITELKAVNPGFDECALRCISSLSEDEKFLSGLADELCKKAEENGKIRASILLSAPLPLRNRALIKIIEKETGITPDYSSIQRINGILSGGACEINGGVKVRIRKDIIEFPREQTEAALPAELKEGITSFGDKKFETKIVNVTNNSQTFSKNITEYRLDYDKIIGKPVIRCRQSGDKIKLFRSGCTKSLKKLFNERAVLPEKRNVMPLIADEAGVILIPGTGFDERVKLTDETKRIIIIKEV